MKMQKANLSMLQIYFWKARITYEFKSFNMNVKKYSLNKAREYKISNKRNTFQGLFSKSDLSICRWKLLQMEIGFK